MSSRFDFKPTQREEDTTPPATPKHTPPLTSLDTGPQFYDNVARFRITQLLPVLKNDFSKSSVIFLVSFNYYYQNREWFSNTSHYSYTIARAIIFISLPTCFYGILSYAVATYWAWQYFRRVSNPVYAGFCSFRHLGLTGDMVLGKLSAAPYIVTVSVTFFWFGIIVFYIV